MRRRMRNILSGLLVLSVASLTGCASDSFDGVGSGGGPGGKGDGDTEEGLHVVAKTTTLGPYNVIRWPVAVDDASDVDDTINAAMAFEVVTGEDLEAIKREWASGGDFHQGLTMADFEVNANIRNVLSVTINYEWLGAYPDMSFVYVNFNSNTGAAVAITDILRESSLPAIATRLDTELQARIAQLKTELAAEIQSGEIEATQWDELHVTVADLASFSTTPDGITFHYDADFPHAIQALEPDGEFEVAFEDLDADISETGLWADEY
jgi:hypothetical protein